MKAESSRGDVDDHVFITRLDPGDGDGPTLAVKDCIDVAGVLTTAGCLVVAEQGVPADEDAACLAGFRAAGARIVGKTNLHELCFGATGINLHYGTPVNPLGPDRIPGGSSSGSAVAVATGQADLALGTDTAGSVRNPAACCGVVGLKTTFGRIPVGGTRPLAPSMDTIGPLARDVAGVIIAMEMLEPGFTPATFDPATLRLGQLRVAGTDQRIAAAVDAAVAQAGLVAEPIVLPGWDRAHRDGLDLMYAEALNVNRDVLVRGVQRLGSDVRERFSRAAQLDAAHLARVRRGQRAWQDELVATLTDVDAVVLPAMPTFPAYIDGADPASNTAAVAVSFAGFPAIALPVATVDGPETAFGGSFPASLQLVGAPGSEEMLVAIAAIIERGQGNGSLR